jgi:hypothetical protein
MLIQRFIHRSSATLLLIMSTVHAESLNYAAFSAGLDDEDGRQYDVYADIGLIEELRFILAFNKYIFNSKNEDFSTRQSDFTLAGHHIQEDQSAFSWSLGVQSWGKRDVIETGDVVLSAGYFFKYNWHLSLGYETGNVELFIRPEFASRATSISSKRRAWRFTTGYSSVTGSVWLSLLKREYEQNLPALDRRPILQRSIKSVALSQAYALSKEELSIGYEWVLEALDIGVDYNRITSVVDDQRSQYLSIFSRYYVGEDVMVNFRVEQEINDSFTVFTAGIGFVW